MTTRLIDPILHDPLPIEGRFPPLFALLGAHGGSGAGTLARVWAPAVDTNGQWPANPHTTQRVLIVAREHMAGVAAAADLLRAADAGHLPPGVRVHGLVLVAAHPGKPEKSVRRYADTVSELAPHTYRVPWCSAFLSLLPSQLPSWKPSDGIKITKASRDGALASVPSAIAVVGDQICRDLDATRTISDSEEF
ncbi:DUF6668 family protein [Gordonia pseudamarae]|jgi:hypothetical protein|uniref:DUF6668 family protein n=1 Tax=Gordonia pseudamarae TaxID=2831662 RepID=UPI001AFA6F7F|nr:DUF6668 family protein [Gordonia pseudamarae]QHN28975.1 hypothetical protein GII33_23115 [Gordonia pseudamarae]